MIKKKCIICGKEFKSKTGFRITCKRKCARLYSWNRNERRKKLRNNYLYKHRNL